MRRRAGSQSRWTTWASLAISSALIYLSLGAGSIAYVTMTAWLSLRRFRARRDVLSGGE